MQDQVAPSVDSLIREFADRSLPHPLVARAVRSAIGESRVSGEDARTIATRAMERLSRSRPTRVINASGILIHTNLGRAPWSPSAVAAGAAAAGSYANLEFDLDTGHRGARDGYVSDLLVELTGAEGALVVNNNAAAVFLTLSVLAAQGSVPVSRGELIEIGGSYRLPDLMAASGARLVEIGTTNRTRLADYATAIGPETRLILKVHPSNYRVSGFTEEATVAQLAALGDERQLPVVFDAGSGLLDESTPWLDQHPPAWLAGEPGIRQSVAAGADLVLFSGDKLLGGPQAGIIVGDGDLIDRLRSSPITRALRVDGVTMSGLAMTLEAYADKRVMEIPLWRMAATSYDDLERRAGEVLRLSGAGGRVLAGASALGGGSVPGLEIPTPVIELSGPADRVFAGLLAHTPPVLARRVQGKVNVDLRAVEPEDDVAITEAIAAACR